MRPSVALTCITLFAGAALPLAHAAASWSPERALAHLDARAEAFEAWPRSRQPDGTTCISCHTTLPWLLARASAREVTGALARAPIEARLVEGIERRVRRWEETPTWYRGSPEKITESRATEAVINALILAAQDRAAREPGRDVTRLAFGHLWALQRTTGPDRGSWPWLHFDLEPWEASSGKYFGAALAALAVRLAPAQATGEAVERVRGPRLLDAYLTAGFDGTNLHNQLLALWAGGATGSADRVSKVLDALRLRQRPDGGWSLESFGSWRAPWSVASDGYATALVVLALEPHSGTNAVVEPARAWLAAHQHASGAWSGVSLNRQRRSDEPAYPFMSDASSGFATLALTAPRERR